MDGEEIEGKLEWMFCWRKGMLSNLPSLIIVYRLQPISTDCHSLE